MSGLTREQINTVALKGFHRQEEGLDQQKMGLQITRDRWKRISAKMEKMSKEEFYEYIHECQLVAEMVENAIFDDDDDYDMCEEGD